jgi:hypothetical protein
MAPVSRLLREAHEELPILTQCQHSRDRASVRVLCRTCVPLDQHIFGGKPDSRYLVYRAAVVNFGNPNIFMINIRYASSLKPFRCCAQLPRPFQGGLRKCRFSHGLRVYESGTQVATIFQGFITVSAHLFFVYRIWKCESSLTCKL